MTEKENTSIRLEGYWEDENFVPTKINGTRITPIRAVPSEEVSLFRESAAIYGKFAKTEWNELLGDEKSDGVSLGDWDSVTFSRVMAAATRPEKVFAEVVWKYGPLWNPDIAKRMSGKLNEVYTWRRVNGVESGWTRTAAGLQKNPLFVWEDEGGRWQVNPKYRDLFDAYFSGSP